MPVVEHSITPWTYDKKTVKIARRYSLLHVYLANYYVFAGGKEL